MSVMMIRSLQFIQIYKKCVLNQIQIVDWGVMWIDHKETKRSNCHVSPIGKCHTLTHYTENEKKENKSDGIASFWII